MPYQNAKKACVYDANKTTRIHDGGNGGSISGSNVSSIKTRITAQPITIAIHTKTCKYFGSLAAGATLTRSMCGDTSTSTDHIVGIVGYTKDSKGKEVWIVRNSWGTSWADKGYGFIEIESSGGGIINTQRYPSYPAMV